MKDTSNPYRKLKVLPNKIQKHLELHEKMYEKGLRNNETFSEFEYYPNHEVIFSRVGLYKLGKDVWLEFKLKDGSYKAIDYSGGGNALWFKGELDEYNTQEKPILEEDWEAIKKLVTRGVLKWEERYRKESQRRELVGISRRMGRGLLGAKKRMKAFKEMNEKLPDS